MDIYSIRLSNLRRLVVKHKSQKLLAEETDIAPALISNILNQRKNLGEKLARRIEKSLKLEDGWLDKMPDSDDESHKNVIFGPEIKGKIPLISWVQAGEWTEALDMYQPGYSDQWVAKIGGGDHAYALEVVGESMIAPEGSRYTFLPGEIIQVDPEQKTPSNGDFVIAKLNGHDKVTFKQYKIEDGEPYLKPLNPSFKPIFDQFRIIGRVVGKLQRF